MKPLAVELFCGLFGWSEGLIAEGYEVIGFDIEDMHQSIGLTRQPEKRLVIQDVLTLHGSQFRDAALIVASPPCQFFSYTAMPWSRAKALAAEVRADPARLAKELALFNACFRIQSEACEAAGRHIPMIVENVRGAIPWVGRSRYNFGSFHLWADVPALMPPIAPRTLQKVPGFRFDGSGKTFQSAAVASEGFKTAVMNWSNRELHGQDFTRIAGQQALKNPNHVNRRDTRHLTNTVEHAEARKHHGDWFLDPTCPSRQGGQVKVADGRKGAGAGAKWFDGNLCVKSSNSPARKAASAMIAKIPLALSTHIARVFHP
jgi:hypothetical protein